MLVPHSPAKFRPETEDICTIPLAAFDPASQQGDG